MKFQGSIVSVDFVNAPHYDVKQDSEGPSQYNDLQSLIDFLNLNHGKYRTTDKTGLILVADDQFVN